MPIPNREIINNFVKLEIYDEVLRARINVNSRYSFSKRKILEDLGIFLNNSAVTMYVTCNGKFSAGHFIIENFPEDDALLGTDFLDEFNIIPENYK